MGNIIQPSGKVNTRWFKDKFEDRGTSQRKAAKEMGLDPSAVSLMLRGLRDIKMEEATDLARILGIPLNDVLANLGVDLSHDLAGVETVPVVGYIDRDGKVVTGRAMGPTKAPAPPGVPEGTVALRDQSETMFDGWLNYYKPVDYLQPEAIGRIAVVEMADTGERLVRLLKNGFEPGTFRLIGVNGSQSDAGKIKSASPILWCKQ